MVINNWSNVNMHFEFEYAFYALCFSRTDG